MGLKGWGRLGCSGMRGGDGSTFLSANVARLCFLHYAVYTFRSTFDVRTNTLPICSFSSSIAAMSFSLI